jgi:2TM domain
MDREIGREEWRGGRSDHDFLSKGASKMATTSTTDREGLRDRAITRLKKKRDFGAHVLAYVLVNAVIVAIWAVTGTGFFWPIFPMLGWGIGLAFNAWDVYRRDLTEAEIEREIEALRRRDG